ncbi:MAG: hypothetical protein KL863_23040 [Rhizobium sp.]|nr:hypothetical protein [Rhizobium sp.]
MTIHDIICDADGWAHHVNGVRRDLFPSRFLAVDAARRSAQRDLLKGLGVTIRYQAADGTMRPIQPRLESGSAAARSDAANA